MQSDNNRWQILFTIRKPSARCTMSYICSALFPWAGLWDWLKAWGIPASTLHQIQGDLLKKAMRNCGKILVLFLPVLLEFLLTETCCPPWWPTLGFEHLSCGDYISSQQHLVTTKGRTHITALLDGWIFLRDGFPFGNPVLTRRVLLCCSYWAVAAGSEDLGWARDAGAEHSLQIYEWAKKSVLRVLQLCWVFRCHLIY